MFARSGLSSTSNNRPQAPTVGLKGLKTTVAAKNTVAAPQDGGQVKEENRKPSLPALTIRDAPFEGRIASSSSPLLFTAEKSTQDVIKVDTDTQTSLSLTPRPTRLPVHGKTLAEAEQCTEYWRQQHEAMEVSLEEAVDRKLEATKLLEFHQEKLDKSFDRLQWLRELNVENGLDAAALEALEHEDDRDIEFTGDIYRKIFDSE